MTYRDQENSLSGGAPYELYEWIGTYANYYYTSDQFPHIFNGITYQPLAGLTRGSIKAGTHAEDNTDLTVTLPITSQLAQDYAFQVTPPALQLNIYRFQRDATLSTDYEVAWSGPVNSITVANEKASFIVPSMFGNLLRGAVPNVYIQPPCNNVLFDAQCKVSRAANSVATTVVTNAGLTLTVGSLTAFPPGWFIGGEVVASGTNERRMIINQAGSVLTLNYSFGKLAIGAQVQVSSGCDHSYTGANGCPKYNNQVNFGGCPFVPGETNDPYAKGLQP